jgi:hypothetical protein
MIFTEDETNFYLHSRFLNRVHKNTKFHKHPQSSTIDNSLYIIIGIVENNSINNDLE